jgi:hypothetical protein
MKQSNIKQNFENLKSLLMSKQHVAESEILNNVPFELYNKWDNFMRGKTCPILDNGEYGVYSIDVLQFLKEIDYD